MLRKHLMACVATLAVLALIPAVSAADVDTSDLRDAVKPRAVFKHQAELEAIADANGATRHTETQGYLDSVDYVVDELESYGYDAKVLQFNIPEWVENTTPTLARTDVDPDTSYTAGTEADSDTPAVDFITFEQSPSATLTDVPVVPVEVTIPSPGGSTSGCEAEDFPAEVAGAVALIQRGTCAFVQKLLNAEEAGAVGVIVFNEGDTPERQNALFISAPIGYTIPAVLSNFETGNELYQAYVNGDNPTVSMSVDAQINDRFFPQVMAETKRGNKNKVVVSGAHLDSVEAGPGINDDGSGTMAQLETAKQIAEGKFKPRQKIRFLFFGGEEDGLIGSLYYADNLTDAQAKKIVVMLDFDMIASSNFARLVYDGDGSEPGNPVGPPGSGEVERVFVDFWASQGRVSEPIPFDGRSDYAGFINRGIPAGGIFAGAEAPKTAEQVAKYGGVEGEQLDPCYHLACDRLSTILAAPPADVLVDPANRTKLLGGGRRSMRQFLPAMVHSIWHFAKAKNPMPARVAAAARKSRKSSQLNYRGNEVLRAR
jgi:Zn-dependent M28 family amino/carboxypeptidase